VCFSQTVNLQKSDDGASTKTKLGICHPRMGGESVKVSSKGGTQKWCRGRDQGTASPRETEGGKKKRVVQWSEEKKKNR